MARAASAGRSAHAVRCRRRYQAVGRVAPGTPNTSRRYNVEPDTTLTRREIPAATEREPEVRRQIDYLGQQVEVLQGVTSALVQRLGPVLVSEPPSEKVDQELSEVVQT